MTDIEREAIGHVRKLLGRDRWLHTDDTLTCPVCAPKREAQAWLSRVEQSAANKFRECVKCGKAWSCRQDNEPCPACETPAAPPIQPVIETAGEGPNHAMLTAGARAIGNTMRWENHYERAGEVWRAMLAAQSDLTILPEIPTADGAAKTQGERI